MIKERTALLVVDMQERLLPAISSADRLLQNCWLLGTAAKVLRISSIATEQYPRGLGPTIANLRELVERTFLKIHFDACREPGFLDSLAEFDRIVVAGAEAHVCVFQTVMGLRRSQKAVSVVADAVGSRAESDKQAALTRMAHVGAEIVTTEMIVFEWLARSDRAEFKELLPHIRDRKRSD